MQLTLIPSDRIVIVNGAKARLWYGHTDKGTAVHALVAAVSPQTHDARELAAFDAELQALPEPLMTGTLHFKE